MGEEVLDNPNPPYEIQLQDSCLRVYLSIILYALLGVALFFMHLIMPPTKEQIRRKG
jgi:hypothetical protein